MKTVLGLIGVLVLGFVIGSWNSSSETAQPVVASSIVDTGPEFKEIVQYRDLPNKDFEKQLPEDLRQNYRTANIAPGEDVWILERVPATYWLLVYTPEKEWFVNEYPYGELPQEDNTKVDNRTAQTQ